VRRGLRDVAVPIVSFTRWHWGVWSPQANPAGGTV